MHVRHLLLCLVFLIPLAGCAERAPSDGPILLEADASQAGEFLAQPGPVRIVGDQLAVGDLGDPWVHVLSLPDLRRLGSFGRRGGGPGEFQNLSELTRDHADPRAFWAYDRGQRRLTRFVLADSAAETAFDRVVTLDDATVYLDAAWLTDSTLVGVGLSKEGRLVVMDRSGRPLRTIGTFPGTPAERALPFTVVQHAWAGPLTVSPDRSRIAVATRQADLIEFFRADGSAVRAVRGGGSFDPAYQSVTRGGGVGMATGDDLRFGYLDLASNARHVYALFSGEKRGEMPGRANFGKHVHVFDWDGEPVAMLELPERARVIDVHPDGRFLVAAHFEPTPTVARYPLPDFLMETID